MSKKDEQADPLNQQVRRKEINMIKSNYKAYDEYYRYVLRNKIDLLIVPELNKDKST